MTDVQCVKADCLFQNICFMIFLFIIVFLINRSPVVSVTMTCHILSVLGDIASNLNDDTKTRIVGKYGLSGLQNVTEMIANSSEEYYLLL